MSGTVNERGYWGVVEGFYGRPWAQAERLDLFERLAAGGLDTYLYAPKDDLLHRARWREPYPPGELERLGALVAAARARGISFLYGLAPGLDLCHAEPADRAALHEKLAQVLELGAAGVALLFDDIPGQLDPADQRRFGSLAAAQADLACEVLERLERRPGPRPALLLCPTEYCTRLRRRPGYLEALGRALPDAVELLWTGPEIVSSELPAAHARQVGALLGRRPVVWDNLHANDYDLRRLHLGPFTGREPALRQELRGLLLNPNCEHEANAPLVHTFAAWLRAGAAFDPRAAWLEALAAWRPAWALADDPPLELTDLVRFADCFYLPHTAGPSALAWWDDLLHLTARPPAEWADRAARFEAAAGELIALCERLTALRRRELLHALYRPAWELKEELHLLRTWVAWRRAHPGQPAAAFRHPHHRGGLLTRLRAVLALDPDEAGLRPAVPAWARFRIRPAVPADEQALYDVCLRTGDSGQDATALHTDPRALGHVYAGPYLRLEPELALVLEDEQGVAGYVLGALDSRAFLERYQGEWLPPLRAAHPAPTGDPAGWTPTQRCYHLLHHPELDLPAGAQAFPSHLHIDLLPRAQGQGQGRRLMEALFARLRARGSPGVHLGVGERNQRAIAFYRRLGFQELERRPGCVYMGYQL